MYFQFFKQIYYGKCLSIRNGDTLFPEMPLRISFVNMPFIERDYLLPLHCFMIIPFRSQGPLTVTIQELDGTFTHNFKIEENKTRFEITCHSKSRRWAHTCNHFDHKSIAKAVDIINVLCNIVTFMTFISRNKKKKIPLCTGEEVDMDLSAMEWVYSCSHFTSFSLTFHTKSRLNERFFEEPQWKMIS